MPYFEYEALLNDREVSERIAQTLMEKFDYLKKNTIKELATYVKKADKDLFLKLKDGQMTLD
jgi:predicted DNA-binding protein